MRQQQATASSKLAAAVARSERAAAAGIDVKRYFDADGVKLAQSNCISKAVRRAELAADPEQAKHYKDAEARRKRVHRIEEGKEDRDALRMLNHSRGKEGLQSLPSTPEGLREVATDGTPRSAKIAGATLRELTFSMHSALVTGAFTFDEVERSVAS